MGEKEFITSEDIKLSLANTPQVTFEVTDRCNLKCEYCGYGELYCNHDLREGKDMEVKTAIKLLDYLGDLWNSPLSQSINNNVYVSFYGGEPLLNFPFIEAIVKYAKTIKNNKRQFTFNMTTNGILIDRYMDFLVQNNVKLLISLDGDEYGNSYRINKSGKNSFDDIIKNVNRLRDSFPNYFAENVNFNAVLHNRNSVASTYNFVYSHYDKAPNIASLNDMGIRDDMKQKFMNMFQNTEESLMDAENYSELESKMFLASPTYHSATVFLMQHSEFKYENYNELLFGKSEAEKQYPTGTCIPFGKKVFVTVNGKILPCERIGHQFALGTVDRSGVNLDFEEIAARYNAWFSKLNPLCSKCFTAKSCIQCIFNLPDITKEKCGCHGFMNEEMYEEYKTAQLSFFARHPEAYSRIMKEVIYK